jgi:DNA-directed RNA polymerase specialized sigma24 family protein
MMLMTHTPPELSPPTAECVEQIGVPNVGRPLQSKRQLKEDTFEQQFSSCRELLHYIACRILTSVDEAERAVRNCHRTASRNPPAFQSEGAFKGWLVRILIDEATLLLPRKESRSIASSKHLPEAR